MAKKPFNRRPRREVIRVNERIRVPEVRVIYGELNAVMPTRRALAKAQELGLDLVEVAAAARPPVCRIVDYGKWRYDQSKQKKDKKPKAKEKEIKFRVRIDPHDYQIKMTRAEDFLAHGYKLRMQLQFRGRENAHKELGFELMKKVRDDLMGMAHIDLEPKLNNRSILMMLSPLPPNKQKPKFRKGDEEVDLEAHERAEAEDAAAHAAEVPDDEHHHHDEEEAAASGEEE
ncbi:MAG: translation initiation factor IF-3 [Akkermansiaceae bacterium]|nr:translation initiation factor IF-3 [Akkermansiaceae bacterium]